MPANATNVEVRFHPNVRRYLYLQSLLVLAATIVGILALPIWIFWGVRWARRRYEALACVLDERSLVVKKGVWFRQEKTIPLDKIQDVSVHHGPILDWLGLTKLVVETAGHGGQGAAASLTGIIDAVDFRDRVLERRDRVARSGEGATDVGGAPTPAATEVGLLEEIRDALLRIEGRV